MTTRQPIAAGSLPDDRRLAVPLFFWSLVQITALAIGAADVPLVVAQARETERWALLLLLAVQFAIGALFAGPLLGSASRAIVNIAIAWPMLQLAGLLAGESQAHVLTATAALTLWLAALACWTTALRQKTWPVVSALAGAWTLGGAALAYCHADFGASPGESVFPTGAWLSPMLGAMQVSTNPGQWGAWGLLAGHCALAAAVLSIARVSRHPARGEDTPGLTAPRP